MYNATSRTNWFDVKDEAAFRAALKPFENIVEIATRSGDDKLMLSAEDNDEGTFPSAYFDENNKCQEVVFHDLVAEHLADGEVAVFISAGADKLRYVSGSAIAIDNTLKTVDIYLSQIYDKAKEAFGRDVEPAEY